ncbi:Lon protease family protein [Sporosalibacterium faouarense]|uniref:Lon protease family protein n=1 Tax=Sporosalibacterium faouarense TaxID=516123 RepID=UPI003C76421A
MNVLIKSCVVPVEQLKSNIDEGQLKLKKIERIDSHKDIIGQERAMKALEFGVSIKRKGYNIFVTGLTGTGRNTYSYEIAKEYAKNRNKPNDWCYVFNFKKPENPKAIKLLPGEGSILKKKVENIIEKLKVDIPKAVSSREYDDRKNVIYHQYKKKSEDVINELNDLAEGYGFIFKQTDKGLVSIPLIDGKPVKESELDNLSEEEIDELRENSSELSMEAMTLIKKLRGLEEQLSNRIKQLKEKIAFDVIDFYINPLIDEFEENKDVEQFLTELEDDVIKNIEEFLHEEEDEDTLQKLLAKKKASDDFFIRYEVNLFIDNSDKSGSPVVRESNPNYYNLLGKIEYLNERGILKTDHTRIKPGTIHEANGGFLIVQAKDILQSQYSWDGLKRALTTGETKIENINKGSVVAETIKPEAIPIDLKVLIIGDYYTYQLLYVYDEEFKKLFKIRADFDIEMDKNEENISKIVSFITHKCKEEGLKEFDKTAIARILEYSSRLASDQRKLTSKFNEIVEIIYEADAWAETEDKKIVTFESVERAIREKNYRNNKYEEKLQEMFSDGTILIDTSGSKVGEINGLAVMDSGQYSFGRPNKITTSTFVGKDGIINIEREVEQSGSIHDKGVLILCGYLGERYAKNKPLSLTASITFEQSYDGIDGDSASSTELYSLLSSLSEVPINQAIAVTGSVNQKGMIQPIGGANEKIEGYFRVCKEKGLTGDQGVIIPHQNVVNLMLDDEIIEAVKEGKFTIYAVKTIDEGIEILTGVPSGKKDEKGNYPVGSINYLVQNKLDRYANINKDFE